MACALPVQAGIPPLRPDRIEPVEPPGIEPLPDESEPDAVPETEPVAPDIDEPDRAPEEYPAPEERAGRLRSPGPIVLAPRRKKETIA
ncbi:hypothetical protein [Erythrobacter sp.]|uniref:hypothetical protein n=1 Tax=Erythrobacter sp. TaxID=1042 RepID=UPI00345C22F9